LPFARHEPGRNKSRPNQRTGSRRQIGARPARAIKPDDADALKRMP
jgi:hypothetical protein